MARISWAVNVDPDGGSGAAGFIVEVGFECELSPTLFYFLGHYTFCELELEGETRFRFPVLLYWRY